MGRPLDSRRMQLKKPVFLESMRDDGYPLRPSFGDLPEAQDGEEEVLVAVCREIVELVALSSCLDTGQCKQKFRVALRFRPGRVGCSATREDQESLSGGEGVLGAGHDVLDHGLGLTGLACCSIGALEGLETPLVFAGVLSIAGVYCVAADYDQVCVYRMLLDIIHAPSVHFTDCRELQPSSFFRIAAGDEFAAPEHISRYVMLEPLKDSALSNLQHWLTRWSSNSIKQVSYVCYSSSCILSSLALYIGKGNIWVDAVSRTSCSHTTLPDEVVGADTVSVETTVVCKKRVQAWHFHVLTKFASKGESPAP